MKKLFLILLMFLIIYLSHGCGVKVNAPRRFDCHYQDENLKWHVVFVNHNGICYYKDTTINKHQVLVTIKMLGKCQ